jgi:hypothetical protein
MTAAAAATTEELGGKQSKPELSVEEWRLVAKGLSSMIFWSPKDPEHLLRVRRWHPLDSEQLRQAVRRIFAPYSVDGQRVNDFAECQRNLLPFMAPETLTEDCTAAFTLEIKPKRCGSFQRHRYRASDLFGGTSGEVRDALRAILEGPEELRKLLKLHTANGQSIQTAETKTYVREPDALDRLVRIVRDSPALALVHRVQRLHSCDHKLMEQLFEQEKERFIATEQGAYLLTRAGGEERVQWQVARMLYQRAARWLIEQHQLDWSHMDTGWSTAPGSDAFYGLYGVACIANDCSVLIRVDRHGGALDHWIIDLDLKPFDIERIRRRARTYPPCSCPHEMKFRSTQT